MLFRIKCCRSNMTRCRVRMLVSFQAGKALLAAATAAFISSCVAQGTREISSWVDCRRGGEGGEEGRGGGRGREGGRKKEGEKERKHQRIETALITEL